MSGLCGCGSGQRDAASAEDQYDDANADQLPVDKGGTGVLASKVHVSVGGVDRCTTLVHSG